MSIALSAAALAAISTLTLPDAQEQYNQKSDELAAVFEEAKSDKGLDFNQVKSLGDEVKGSAAVAEFVQLKNAELSALFDHITAMQGAELAVKDHESRGKALNRFQLPGLGGDGGGWGAEVKGVQSLGDQVAGAKAYTDWAKAGAVEGVSVKFENAAPSDFLAQAANFETVGTKALMSTTAGFAPEVIRMGGMVEAATRPIQVLDIIPTGRTGQAAIKYMEETTRTHGAAEVAEGGAYAESEFVFTERTVSVQKIGDSVPVTDEQLEDAPQMSGYINGRLSFGVRRRVDQQVVAGGGTGSDLRGIQNTPGIQTHARGADNVPDAFYKAMTKVRVTGRAMPTHHLIHPEDWQNVRLMKTSDGVYIWGNPSEAGPERLFGIPVVQTDILTVGTGLTGSFQPAFIMLLERRGVDVQIGFVGTQFLQGRRTIRADMRAALIVTRPAAFCQVTGLNA